MTKLWLSADDSSLGLVSLIRHLLCNCKLQVNIVGMLVTLSANPETVDEVIRDLGKRHVTYGVASHHVPVMKQVVLTHRIATRQEYC